MWLASSALGPGNARAITLLANPDSYTVSHDRTLIVAAPGVLANDVGILGGSTAVRDSGPTHGLLTLQANGAFTYTPAAGYVGKDVFEYHAHDGVLNTLRTTVTIMVTNALPVATDDGFSAMTGVTKSVPAPGVLANDTDADGDALTAELVDGGGNGSLDLNADGSFTFKSGGSFVGDRTFTYRVSDGIGWSNIATVTIKVGTSPAPTATPPATGSPSPVVIPTLPPVVIPTLPPVVIPTLPPVVIPTLPPVATPTATPTSSGGPTQSLLPGTTAPTPTSTPRATLAPDATPATPLAIGGPGNAGGDVDEIGGIDAVALSTLGGLPGGVLAWSYPALVLSVPGVLVLLVIGAQAIGALAWLPLVRRRLGGFGLRDKAKER